MAPGGRRLRTHGPSVGICSSGTCEGARESRSEWTAGSRLHTLATARAGRVFGREPWPIRRSTCSRMPLVQRWNRTREGRRSRLGSGRRGDGRPDPSPTRCDGTDTPGLFRPSNHTTYLRHTNTQGNADEAWSFAESGRLRVPDVGLDDPSDRLGSSPRSLIAASRTTLWDASC